MNNKQRLYSMYRKLPNRLTKVIDTSNIGVPDEFVNFYLSEEGMLYTFWYSFDTYKNEVYFEYSEKDYGRSTYNETVHSNIVRDSKLIDIVIEKLYEINIENAKQDFIDKKFLEYLDG